MKIESAIKVMNTVIKEREYNTQQFLEQLKLFIDNMNKLNFCGMSIELGCVYLKTEEQDSYSGDTTILDYVTQLDAEFYIENGVFGIYAIDGANIYKKISIESIVYINMKQAIKAIEKSIEILVNLPSLTSEVAKLKEINYFLTA